MWPFKKKKIISNIIKAEEVQPKDMNTTMILNLEAKHFLKVNGNESIDMLKPFLKLTSKQLNKGII
jgi:hypothetical protein